MMLIEKRQQLGVGLLVGFGVWHINRKEESAVGLQHRHLAIRGEFKAGPSMARAFVDIGLNRRSNE